MQAQERISCGALELSIEEHPGLLFSMWHKDDESTRVAVDGPLFEVDGHERGDFVCAGLVGGRALPRGGQEITLRYVAAGTPALDLLVDLRCYPASPVLRFRYRLYSDASARLTKNNGKDRLRYLHLRPGAFGAENLTEIQLSHFDPVAHSYMPNVETREAGDLFDGLAFAGPIAVLHNQGSLLLAYEHGADHPHCFLEFKVVGDQDHAIELLATKGNYYHGQLLDSETPWRSVWFELAIAPFALNSILERYRTFFLEEICENTESRRPYLYYNTWNYQERNKYFRGEPYLKSMRYQRIADEIDVAHRIGIDVFVIDTGWYEKTGDWRVNVARFPDELKDIKRKLDGYNMRLGLWFNPTVAAVTSEIYRSHPEYRMMRGGELTPCRPIWETEESCSMCLASDYTDAFIEELVRLYQEVGVTYFKWDAISQYGCDSPHHHHGTAENSEEERADCYAYQMGLELVRIVEEVTRRCPNAIVDFDITEGGRFVGLGFLSAGKYFLINNGPYFSDFDIPPATRIEPDTINVFFYPGPARSRICRQSIKFDVVVPSILFMTHFLPDPPELSQRNSLASLMLGGNGIWGDLLSLDEGDIAFLSQHLARYKRVADATTRAYPRVTGFAGSSPEIYEKIDAATATGLIIFFTVTPSSRTYLTKPLALDRLEQVEGADEWEQTPDGRLKIRVELVRDDARVVYLIGS